MRRRRVAAAVLLSVCAPVHLFAQDTSAIDRGVRIGIVYRPGVRPGLVMLPGRGAMLDSVRVVVARDLDFSDRFEVITLPGGDSIRLAGTASATRSGGGAAGAGAGAGGTRAGDGARRGAGGAPAVRSEERRVGKECRL